MSDLKALAVAAVHIASDIHVSGPVLHVSAEIYDFLGQLTRWTRSNGPGLAYRSHTKPDFCHIYARVAILLTVYIGESPLNK